MTNNDDVIVMIPIKPGTELEGLYSGRKTYPVKSLNLSELADKASDCPSAQKNSIDYYDGFVDGIEFFLSKIREAMK